MGFPSLTGFANHAPGVVAGKQLTPPEALLAGWQLAGQPNIYPAIVDLSYVARSIHKQVSAAQYAVKPMATYGRFKKRDESDTMQDAERRVKVKTAQAVMQYVHRLHAQLTAKELQDSIRWILVCDNAEALPEEKAELWKSRHTLDAQHRHLVHCRLSEPSLHSFLSCLTDKQLQGCASFPSANDFDSLPECQVVSQLSSLSTAASSTLFDTPISASRLPSFPQVFVIDAATEADFAYKDLSLLLSIPSFVWSGDRDWCLTSAPGHLSSFYAAKIQPNDYTLCINTSNVWSLAALDEALHSTSLHQKAWLRALAGDDYRSGLKGCGIKTVVGYGLHKAVTEEVDAMTAKSQLEAAIAMMPGRQALRTNLLHQLSLATVGDMLHHVYVLLNGPSKTVAKSDLLKAVNSGSSVSSDTIEAPFGSPSAKPEQTALVHVSGHAQSPATSRYLARQPGRQAHMTGSSKVNLNNIQSNTDDEDSSRDGEGHQNQSSSSDSCASPPNANQPDCFTFSSLALETPFEQEDSTKSKKRRRRRKAKSAATADAQPQPKSAAEQRRTAAQQHQQAREQAEHDLTESAQSELNQLRESRKALNDLQAESNGGKSGVNAFQRRLFPSPGMSVCRHLTASAAGDPMPDHSPDQSLVWIADCTNKAFASVSRASFLFLKGLSSTASKADRRKALSSFALPRTLAVLARAMTMPTNLVDSLDQWEAHEHDLDPAYRALADQCLATESQALAGHRSGYSVAMAERLKALNILPQTWLTLASERSGGSTYDFPKALNFAMVAAINQTFKEGFPYVTTSHLGLDDRLRVHASNICQHLSLMAVSCGDLAAKYFFRRRFEPDMVPLCPGDFKALFEWFMIWALDQDLAQPLSVQCTLVEDLSISDQRKFDVSRALTLAAEDLVDYLAPYFEGILNVGESTSLRSVLKSRAVLPCDLLPYILDTCALSGAEFDLSLDAGKGLYLTHNDICRFIHHPNETLQELESWLHRHRALLSSSKGTSSIPRLMDERGIQIPGHKPPKTSRQRQHQPQHRLVYNNILDRDIVWSLDETSKSSIVAYTNEVKRALGFPPSVGLRQLEGVGSALFASVCFLTEHLKQTWLPTGRILVKPSGTSVEAIDVCRPLEPPGHPDVLQNLSSTCRLTPGENGCPLITADDLLRLRNQQHHLFHYVNDHSSLHRQPRSGVKMSHSNVSVARFKSTEHHSSANIQPTPILVNIPWAELLAARGGSQPESVRHPSALSLLHGAGRLHITTPASTSKSAPSGLPHFRKASKSGVIQTLQQMNAAQPDLLEVAEEIRGLQNSSPSLSAEAAKAVGRMFDTIPAIGVDMGQVVEMGIHGHTRTGSGQAAGFEILFNSRAFRNQTAQLQRKKAFNKLTLPESTQQAFLEHKKGSLRRHWADGTSAYSALNAAADAEARRQHDRELGRRVSQLSRSLGAEPQVSLAQTPSQAPVRILQKGDPVLLAVGRDFKNPKGPFFGNKTLEHLLLRLHGLGFKVLAFSVSEFCSSQRCCNVDCQRPREDDWEAPQTDEEARDLANLRLRRLEGTSLPDDPSLVRSKVYPFVYNLSGKECLRVMQCETCLEARHRDLQSGELIHQSLVHQFMYFRHPFEPAE